MTEKLKPNETIPHWCPEYRAIQQNLAALEQELAIVDETPPAEYVPEVWEGRTGYWGSSRSLPETEETLRLKESLRTHREECSSCIKHFASSKEQSLRISRRLG